MPKDSPKNEPEDNAAKGPWWLDLSMRAIKILLVVLIFWFLEPYLGVIGSGVVTFLFCWPVYLLIDLYIYPGVRLRRR